MYKEFLTTIFCVTICLQHNIAQTTKAWKGKKCAVVLTYDDAINEHLDNAIPILDRLNLKASFYITAYSNAVEKRLNEWRNIAKNGHELGNHSLFHPCEGNKPGRSFVTDEYNLNNYSIKRMIDEIRMTNIFLQALDQSTERTFAFTCGDMKIKDSSFIQPLQKDFIAARAVRNEMHKIEDINVYNIDCFMVNNHTANQMIAWTNKAIETNSLLVILFHGVGGGNGLNVELQEHRRFLEYLKQQENNIWIAPLIEVAKHVKEWQKVNKQ